MDEPTSTTEVVRTVQFREYAIVALQSNHAAVIDFLLKNGCDRIQFSNTYGYHWYAPDGDNWAIEFGWVLVTREGTVTTMAHDQFMLEYGPWSGAA